MGWNQGLYNPINPQKLIGPNPVYRSGWEKKFFLELDRDVNVIRWGSEIVVIKYKHLGDNRIHSYYVDLYFEKMGKQNQIYKVIIEIKPDNSLRLPEKPKKKSYKSTKSYNYRLNEYQKNISKWIAASSYARMAGFDFYILTEKGIYEYPLKKISDKNYFT